MSLIFFLDDEDDPKPLPPLMCYHCTSDPFDYSTHPGLPYHRNCGQEHGLPDSLLIQCDSNTDVRDVSTIYDLIGAQERNNFISERPLFTLNECGKFTSSKTRAVRRGCSWTTRFFAYEEKVFKGDEHIVANYCMSPKCNQGTTTWLSGAVILLSMGAVLARFAY